MGVGLYRRLDQTVVAQLNFFKDVIFYSAFKAATEHFPLRDPSKSEQLPEGTVKF